MAIVYSADLSPTKPGLIADWLRRQAWFDDADGPIDEGSIDLVGAFRFDDPAGEVGIETHLVRGASGTLYQVPLTYRGAPLEGAESRLVTTMTHSVLGDRWVYEAVIDPVAIAQVRAAILAGGQQVDVFADGATTPLPVSVAVRGTGDASDAPVTTPASAGLPVVTARGADVVVAGEAGALVFHPVVAGVREAALRLDAVSGLDGAPATLVTFEPSA